MAAASFVWYFGSWSSPSSSGLERKPHSTSTARLGMWFIRYTVSGMGLLSRLLSGWRLSRTPPWMAWARS